MNHYDLWSVLINSRVVQVGSMSTHSHMMHVQMLTHIRLECCKLLKAFKTKVSHVCCPSVFPFFKNTAISLHPCIFHHVYRNNVCGHIFLPFTCHMELSTLHSKELKEILFFAAHILCSTQLCNLLSLSRNIKKCKLN